MLVAFALLARDCAAERQTFVQSAPCRASACVSATTLSTAGSNFTTRFTSQQTALPEQVVDVRVTAARAGHQPGDALVAAFKHSGSQVVVRLAQFDRQRRLQHDDLVAREVCQIQKGHVTCG